MDIGGFPGRKRVVRGDLVVSGDPFQTIATTSFEVIIITETSQIVRTQRRNSPVCLASSTRHAQEPDCVEPYTPSVFEELSRKTVLVGRWSTLIGMVVLAFFVFCDTVLVPVRAPCLGGSSGLRVVWDSSPSRTRD